MGGAAAWMRDNSPPSGYCLSDAERRELVTATNLCLPSEMFAWLERRRAPNDPITT